MHREKYHRSIHFNTIDQRFPPEQQWEYRGSKTLQLDWFFNGTDGAVLWSCKIVTLTADKEKNQFKLLLVLYKAMYGLTPDYVTVLATPYVPQRHLRSANLLIAPKIQLHYGDITFTVAAAKIWNELPTVIKLSGNVNIFKKNLKTHSFTQIIDSSLYWKKSEIFYYSTLLI